MIHTPNIQSTHIHTDTQTDKDIDTDTHTHTIQMTHKGMLLTVICANETTDI